MASIRSSELRSLLADLASEFDRELFETDLCNRFSHHAAHLAPERWLALELAYFVNRRKSNAGRLKSWSAIVEHKGIDLLLIPPDIETWNGPELIDGSVRLELKVVDTGNWRHAWKEVKEDMDGMRTRSPANCSVCLIMHSLSEPKSRRRQPTLRRHEGYFESVPDSPGNYEPPDTEYNFLVVCSTSPKVLEWQHEVRSRWPESYKARVRLVWVMRSNSPCT